MLMQLIIGKRKLGRRDQNTSILQGIWDNEKSWSKVWKYHKKI
jgi:hypothetical protein